MFSEKGKNLFVRDDFKFRFHKNLANDVQRWACTEKKCTAFLKMSAGIIIDDANVDRHNHEPVQESSSFTNKTYKYDCYIRFVYRDGTRILFK